MRRASEWRNGFGVWTAGAIALWGSSACVAGCGGSTTDDTSSTSPAGGGSGAAGSGGSSANAGNGVGGTNSVAGTGGSAGASGSGGASGGGVGGASGSGGAACVATQKVDLLFLIDNSSSMGDKQSILSKAVGELVGRLVNPLCVGTNAMGQRVTATATSPSDPCPDAADGTPTKRELAAIEDMHIGVVSSSLGGIGSDTCTPRPSLDGYPSRSNNASLDDHGHLLARSGVNVEDLSFSATIPGYVDAQGESASFLAWDPGAAASPPAPQNPGKGTDTVATTLVTKFSSLIEGVNQVGCGFEQQMEGWYRFLADPRPPSHIEIATFANGPSAIDGPDVVLLQQRADFLRPDSLLSIVVVSDENEHSTILGVLPEDVCETPTFAADGHTPTGCNGAHTPWPASYRISDNWDATGKPHPYNFAQLQLYATPDDAQTFPEWAGTAACATDPYDAACKECFTPEETNNGLPDPSCVQIDGTASDVVDLRQWDSKRRFGWDAQYPVQRYVDALHEPRIYDADGYKVPNPIFDDLPYEAAQNGGPPIDRAKLPPRDPSLVMLTTIVGVPWQDITQKDATGHSDLSAGYLTADQIDWSLVIGDPYAADPTKRDPGDPLMLEAQDRAAAIAAAGGKHPVTGETLDDHTWNSINGHEWNAVAGYGLQYTCFVALAEPTDCTQASEDCDCSSGPFDLQSPSMAKQATAALQSLKNPLCEPPSNPDDPSSPGAGQAAITGSAAFKQYRAHAYSGRKFLQIVKGLHDAGGTGIAASICARNVAFDDPAHADDADLGYRPAMEAIIEEARKRLLGPFACNGL